MKRETRGKWCVLLMVFLLAALILSIRSIISSEQAKEIVRQCEGNPALQLSKPSLKKPSGASPFYERNPYYEIHSKEAIYKVDAKRGYIRSVDYFHSEVIDNPQWLLTSEQALEIARRFCKQKYPRFESIEWEVRVTKSSPTSLGSYLVTFGEKGPNGAKGLNGCYIRIHPDSGEVIWYSANVVAPPPTWQPNITKEEAIEKIARVFKFVEVLDVEDKKIELLGGNNKLIWSIQDMRGLLPNGQTLEVLGYVNAMDGKVLYVDRYMSSERAYNGWREDDKEEGGSHFPRR